ncbi:MAG: 16S rRNA (Guanine(966)-N(2))-methyltransferase RsmD [uncultured Thiotrichaceae bacterium]|uniref:Ribosomal RNA small subunit methyltransferase D n=1 Tax=uncultured Thiotrichaceae bacterium TaxID=298394 RepID=A0A6S6SYF8_9GAMM|nr:MAG: 16S rRNA (Guanine(966)-N(2))-methyltransferase RsmD [uncultured Thiotrichaceae bacterium]
MARRKKAKKPSRSSNHFRIIAGTWRGRKLSFPNAEGLRPTPDRVRETVFNWLQGNLYQARVLDLFAGSGALGLEALSRGASELVMVEKASHVACQLQENIAILQANASVVKDDALTSLKTFSAPFDVIFLDPPYRKDLLVPVLSLIKDADLLTEQGCIYLEHEQEVSLESAFEGFRIVKSTKAGQVRSFLLEHHHGG